MGAWQPLSGPSRQVALEILLDGPLSRAELSRRVGLSPLDGVLEAARRRLGQTQRTDGGWASDDGDAFDVHTTLAAIRGLR